MSSPVATNRRERWEATQRLLWGRRPEDWAQLAEPQNLGLIEAALDAGGVGKSTELLDVGCGSGLLLARAAARGARATGLDIAPTLLAIARRRVGDATLREGGIDELAFEDARFDVVTAVNALQFAFAPAAALREIARVLAPGGRCVIGGFAAPERCESTALHEAMEALVPAASREDHAPYALAAPGALEAALAEAGLAVTNDRELAGDWRYADDEQALRGILCSAGGTRAIELVGEDRARVALQRKLGRFRTADRSIVMHNHFRLLVAERPAARAGSR